MTMNALLRTTALALTFLAGLERPQVTRHLNPLGGSTAAWQITSAGVLAHERLE